MSVFDRFRLHGRRALITGGTRGLGRVMAQALAEAGADLVLVARDPKGLAESQKALFASTGRGISIIDADAGDPKAAEQFCQHVLSEGPIDILINNVGGRRLDTPTEDLALADWHRLLDLNLTSALVCCQLLGKGMLARRKGSIINVTSIAGPVVIKGIRGRTYETAKAALGALTRCLAADWAPHNVRVNAIAPGVFLTDPNRRWFGEKSDLRTTFEGMIPMGRLAEPEEIGPLALYLASDASSYMTGATLVIDGGYTLW